jgi:hypothetical protein
VLKEKSTEFVVPDSRKNQSEHNNTLYDPNFIETNPKSQTFQVHFGRTGKWETTIIYERKSYL